jgi:hypothetical protein
MTIGRLPTCLARSSLQRFRDTIAAAFRVVREPRTRQPAKTSHGAIALPRGCGSARLSNERSNRADPGALDVFHAIEDALHLFPFDACPIGSSWRARRLGGVGSDRLNLAAVRRILRARRIRFSPDHHVLDSIWQVVPDDGSVTPVDPATEKHLVPGTPGHVHTTVAVHGHIVHVDRLSARLTGPTFTYVEYRIFVDRVLAGLGGRTHCGLGAPSAKRSVAIIGGRHVILVAERQDGSPLIESRVFQGWTSRVTVRGGLPLLVSTGILTQRAFDRLPHDLRVSLEREARQMATRYGADSLRDDADRHREDLSLVYGIDVD